MGRNRTELKNMPQPFADQILSDLTRQQIAGLKIDYLRTLEENRFPKLEINDHHVMLAALKRNNHSIGPYVGITVFEAANRIATDLTMLEGVEMLFVQGLITAQATVTLRLGTKHEKTKGDFSITDGDHTYEGESFDANKTFFKSKLSKTLRKWQDDKRLRFIIFNQDSATDPSCAPYLQTQKNNPKNDHIQFVGVTSWHK